MQKQTDNKITVRAFALGLVIAAVFAMMTMYFGHRRGILVTSTQIPVLPYILLMVMVLLINPLCRLIRVVRRFSAAEILVVFCMGLVSSGVSTFGLSSQLVPLMSGLFNEAWNNDQSRWNQYVAPHLDEAFFVAEPGIQAVSKQYLDVVNTVGAERRVYDSALRVVKARELIHKAQAEIGNAQSLRGSESTKAMALNRARSALLLAENSLVQAERHWKTVCADGQDPDPVVRDYPERLVGGDAAVQRVRDELAALEREAFERVRLFRRGLPVDARAYPGMVPIMGEGNGTYVARVRRMFHGRRSLDALNDARSVLLAGTAMDQIAGQVSSSLKVAGERLTPILELETIRQSCSEIENKVAVFRESRVAVETRLAELHQSSRDMSGAEARAIESKIATAKREQRSLARTQESLESDLAGWSQRLLAAEVVQATVTAIEELDRELSTQSPEAVLARLDAIRADYAKFDASIRRFWLGDVPWQHWVNPLVRWGLLIGLTYLVLMAFNMLIFRQWAYHEKLIYPLAELPEHLAGAVDSEDGIPVVFKSGLFWSGFAIAAAFLGWNMLCYSDVVTGIKPLDFKHFWKPFVEKSALAGLVPTTRSEIFFTMVGLSFLIPKKISFSLWFFSALYMVQLLVLVWLGYGVNESSFETEWWTILNFRTAQGGGALLVFSAVVLWKCRHYIACCVAPDAIRSLDRSEQVELRLASCVFLLGSAGIVLLLWRGMGANLGYTIFFWFFVLLITVGLVRAVTEGGLLGFQAWSGPFHFIRAVFGMDRTWTSPSLFAPLMVYYGVLFLDIKAFIAPAMANALKIRSDLRIKRFQFHAAILLAVALAAVIGVLGEIMMGYAGGADEMNSWFYSSFPNVAGFGQIKTLIQSPPAASPAQTGWIVAGALGMAALLYFRQFAFWLPHPIGMIMLVNPIMIAYWFSILLGWMAKSLVTKYGNKDVYARVRCLFLGLIAGELVIVALAMLVSYLLDVSIPIDLNRNAA
ncbi:MAG: hypothetical protein A2340_12115 [Lentisphaerae bacterium RIFOXYB12_FULL_60_10]|nr:MAG: hypothetical protein A2340_12115 [Lentisphaerae bacterium RIFOXYB12_FULL_60_10]